MDTQLVSLARQIALKHGLDDALICGLCEQESGWNPNATRYEPAFYQRYIVPLIASQQLSDGEAKGRATSWGALQVMGQVAREHGFAGPFQQLLDPQTGIDMGCTVFASKLKAADGDTYTALMHYNGGGNDRYADQVTLKMAKYVQPAELNAQGDT